jgi:hypothetical protein
VNESAVGDQDIGDSVSGDIHELEVRILPIENRQRSKHAETAPSFLDGPIVKARRGGKSSRSACSSSRPW